MLCVMLSQNEHVQNGSMTYDEPNLKYNFIQNKMKHIINVK